MAFEIATYLAEKKKFVEEALSAAFPEVSGEPETLARATRYSLFADGKRIRPILVLSSAGLLGMPEGDVLPIACTLEMIHVFSLVHDDLPAMDDDDLRRGRPTNHKVFGEAVAILAGDALFARAIVPLTELDTGRYGVGNVLAVIRLIAEATGSGGMIGGQVIDLESEGKTLSLERLRGLHRMKTGALIRAAVTVPAILQGATRDVRSRLESYGEAIGLAFQISDDILDIEGGKDLGKDIGSDIAGGKATYPALLGMDGAKSERERTLSSAIEALVPFGDKAEPLRALARFIVERKK